MSDPDGYFKPGEAPVHPVTGPMHAACIKEEGCRVSPGITFREYAAVVILGAIATRRGLSLDDTAKAVECVDSIIAELAKAAP